MRRMYLFKTMVFFLKKVSVTPVIVYSLIRFIELLAVNTFTD